MFKTRYVSTVLLLCCASGAAASDVDMRFNARGVGDNSIYIRYNGDSMNVFAGSLVHTFRNGSSEASVLNGQTVATFCTELSQHASQGVWRNDANIVEVHQAPFPGVGMGHDKARAIQEVWAAAGDMKFTNDHMAAALQVMIWEIIADFGSYYGVRLDKGDFKVTSGMTNTALNYFYDLKDAIGSGIYEQNLRAVVHGQGQDQLIVIPVPLPSAAAAAALGCCLVAAPRRRRRGL